ncbi:MAG: peptidase, partial [Nitrosopumilus sp.]|nr:peptidase [Nitrosopumilus sp.]
MNLLFLLPIVFAFFLVGGFSNSFAEIESVNVVENKPVILIGEGIDSDAENLTFKWIQVNGEPVSLSSYTVSEPTFMAPEVKNGEIKVLTFELTVTDPQGANDSATIEIIVNPVNSPPHVDAGRDLFTLQTISAMTITPSISDPDDDVLTYQWEQVDGQVVGLSSTVEKYLTLRPITFDFTNTEPLKFKITADDGFGGMSSDTVRVH